MSAEYSIIEQKELLERMLEPRYTLYNPKDEREISIIKECFRPLNLVRYFVGDDGSMIVVVSTDYAKKFLELDCFKYVEEINTLKKRVSELEEENMKYKKHWLFKLIINK